MPIKGYQYNVTQSIPLVSANWWFIAELFPKIRSFQEKNKDNPDIFQHRKGRLIPLTYPEFDWFDHEYAEWYICRHAKVHFRFETYMDPVGYTPWTERSLFDFKCYLTRIHDNRIRSYHWIPL